MGGFLALTFVVVVAAWQAFEYSAKHIRADIASQLLTIAELKRAAIAQSLREREGDGTVLAALPAVWSVFEDTSAASVAPLVRAFDITTKAYGYQRIIAFDKAGHTVLPGAQSVIQPDVQNQVAGVLASGRPAFVDMLSETGGCLCYGKIVAVHGGGSPEREVVGAIYLEVDAGTHLLPQLKRWAGEAVSAETALIRKEGDGVRPLLSSQIKPGPVLPWRPHQGTSERRLGQRAAHGETGIIRNATDFRGVPVIGAALAVEGTPWFLIAQQDLEEADEPVRDLRTAMAVLQVLFILLFGIITYLVWRAKRDEWIEARSAVAQRYEAAISASIDAFLRVSPTGYILEVNEAAAKLAGRSVKQVQSLALWDIDSAIPREAFPTAIDRIRTAGTARFRSQWRRPDESLVDVDVSVTHVPGDDGGYFQSFVRDITADLAQTRRLEQLNRFHRFLLKVNHEVAMLRDPNEVMRAFCEAAVLGEMFELVWVGTVDEPSGHVLVRAAAGACAEYVSELTISVDPSSPFGQGATGSAIRERRTMVIADFLNDPRTVAWHERARRFGFGSSAAAPIVVGGRGVGAVNFYAKNPDAFDGELVALIEESMRTLALACEAGRTARALDDEHALRTDIEHRYESIFRESPLPMQLHAIADRRMTAINKAHQQLFGYPLDELRGNSAWFEKAFPDPGLRDAMRADWEAAIQRAVAKGEVVDSPEIALRCRDGSERIVVGHMSAKGNDLICSWTDLTGIRRSESALRDSERRFRAMVEQMVAGFFVSQDEHFVYVNPCMAEMLGYSRDELIGLNPRKFVARQWVKAIAEARARLEKGEHNVSCRTRVRQRGGEEIVVNLLLAGGVWAGRPALFAVVENITERALTEEKAASYLIRLEEAMRGTLHAVARMVDLRDPYTAGHERRVGLVAAAIARELHWSEDRCQMLELLGLVHDVGKVAVPAELLSKPTRLTHNEFELIKTHAQAGYDILKDVQFHGIAVAEIVRQHHERLDGRGYPRGLKGDEILPEARVLAVADVLESMASHRPYRPALGMDAALAELEKGKGNAFDPEVVDTAVRMVREKGYLLPA